MKKNRLTFHSVQCLAHLSRSVLVVIKVANECCNGALKVDVVFPQGVVGVDEQRLAGRELGFCGHR